MKVFISNRHKIVLALSDINEMPFHFEMSIPDGIFYFSPNRLLKLLQGNSYQDILH